MDKNKQNKIENYLEISFHFDSPGKLSPCVKRDMVLHALETFDSVFGSVVLGFAMHKFLEKKISH